MDIICQGILAGLWINILVGPIFFGLIQLAAERGARAGLIYAAGIWLSDILLVFAVQNGTHFFE